MKIIKVTALLSFIFSFSSSAFANSGGGEAKEEAPPAAEAPAEFENIKVYKIEEAGRDIRVPSKIWIEIFGDDKIKSDSISFSPMRVRFKEKNSGVLIEPEFVVELARGGGEIDLSRFVTNKQGTFSIFFDASDVKSAKNPHVFFVSKGRKRKIEGEVWGAGCKTFLNLTDFMMKQNEKTGIEVNTTRSRHLSVLMGHFIFAADKKLTQVTFTDSSQPSLNCDTAGDK